MEPITFKTDNAGITIHIPRDLLIHIALNAPEPIEVFNPEKFAEQVAYELENNLGLPDSGLTGFQELIDNACTGIAEQGSYADFVDLS